MSKFILILCFAILANCDLLYVSDKVPNRSMDIGNAGFNLIKEFEGCVLHAYKCPAGVWTIGYGHTDGVYEGMVISQQQAEDFLRQDLAYFVGAVNRVGMGFEPNQNQFDALVSFSFNLGEGNLAKLLSGCKQPAQVAQDMLQYCHCCGGKVLPGLVRRREAEKALFES